MTRALRDELHFSDLIVTDAMDMKGLAAQFPPGEAAVRAVEAGADVLLMPPDPERAMHAIVSAVTCRKRVVRRQDHAWIMVGGCEMDYALIVRVRVTIWVEGRDDHIEGPPRTDARRSSDEEVVSRS